MELPASEMNAAIDVRDATSDPLGLGQVHDRIRNVLDRQRPIHPRQALHHVLRSLPVRIIHAPPILKLGPVWTAEIDAECFCFNPPASLLRVWVEVDMGNPFCG